MSAPETDESIDWPALEAAALEARDKAYAPYSGYRVGAALLAPDGTIYRGANVENASYGLCLCAERSAIAAAVVDGVTNFRGLVVATRGPVAAAPCGMCRQVLVEFAPSFPVRCITASGDVSLATDVATLQPHPFGPSYLDDV